MSCFEEADFKNNSLNKLLIQYLETKDCLETI